MEENLKNQNMVSSVEAAARFGRTNDYITLLARQKKVRGTLVGGRLWFVDVSDVEEYLSGIRKKQEERNQELSKQFTDAHRIPTPEPTPLVVETPVAAQISEEHKTLTWLYPAAVGAMAMFILAGSTVAMSRTQVAQHSLASAAAESGLWDRFTGWVATIFFHTTPVYVSLPETQQSNSTTVASSVTTAPAQQPAQQLGPVPPPQQIVKVVSAPSVDVSKFVTKDFLNGQINDLRSLIYQQSSSGDGYIPGSLYSTGGIVNNLALSQKIDHLDGVTITGAVITNSTVNGVSDLSSLGSSGVTFNYPFPSDATSTFITFNGGASTSQLFGAGLATCNSGNVLTWAGGLFGCAADQTSTGQQNPFTWASDFGVLTAATTSPLWAQNGIFASSTSRLSTTTFTGSVGVGSTSPSGTLAVTSQSQLAGRTFVVANSDNRDRFVVDASGTVGIQSTAPILNLINDTAAGGTLGFYSEVTNQQAYIQSEFLTTAGANLVFNHSSQSNGAHIFKMSGVEQFRVDSTGNVGVGTTSPFAKLSISANLGDTNTTLFAIASTTGGTSTSTLFSVNNIGFATLSDGLTSGGSITGLFVNSTRFVSAGTGVQGGLCISTRGCLSGATSGSDGQLYLGDWNTNTTFTRLGFGGLANTNPALTRSGTALSVSLGDGTLGGQFGIGTTSPYAQFAINAPNGSPTTTLFVIASSTATATTTLFSVSNTGDATLVGTLTVGSCVGCSGGSAFPFTSTTNFGTTTAATTTSLWLRGELQASSTVRFGTATTSALTYDSTSGFLGFSTTSANTRFAIQATTSATTDLLSFYTAGGLRAGGFFTAGLFSGTLQWANNGANSYNFSVDSAGNVVAATFRAANGTAASPTISFSNNTNTGFFGATSGNFVGVSSAGSEVARFTSTSLGLGTTTPTAKLTVASHNGTGLLFMVASSSTGVATSTLFSVDGNGSTTLSGIGSALLKVVNNTIVAAVAGVDYAAGNISFPYTPTTNFGVAVNSTSTPIWAQAGIMASSTARFTDISTIGIIDFATTSLNATSTLVTVSGQTFLTASTTNFSTSLGLGALANATTTSLTGNLKNTAIGYQALMGTSTATFTGSSNTAVGYKTLSVNATGSNNSAFGASALSSNTSGTNNSAFGQNALSANTTGTVNAAFGSNALTVNTTGSNNSAFGGGSGGATGMTLGSNITGNNNSAFGILALKSNTSGDNNVAFGYQAGSTVSTGYANILLGSHLSTSNVITTGNGNIGLGNELYFASVAANNQLNIGNILFGTLPATTTQFQLPTSGSIGVGTSSPFAKFSIQTNNGDTATTLFAIGSSTATATTTLFAIDNKGTINLNLDASTSTLFTFNNGATFLTASTTGNNTSLGIDALSKVTSGFSNTAIGKWAMASTTSASSNVAIGYRALGSLLNGNGGNVAIGANALAVATGIQSSVAIGFGALPVATQINNTGVGSGVLASLTTGQSNTAIGGLNSGGGVTTGSSNSYIGASAGTQVTGGSSFNTILGASAGIGASGAIWSGSTYVGYQAGSSTATGGSNNVAVGYRSAGGLTSGYGNIILGGLDDTAALGTLTTGDGNIFIGQNVFASTTDASGGLNIGNLLFGTLPATSTTFRLPSSGALGVGTSSPFAKFSIQTNNGDTATTLFAIGSSTATATTTLFAVSNTGAVTTSDNLTLGNSLTLLGQNITFSSQGSGIGMQVAGAGFIGGYRMGFNINGNPTPLTLTDDGLRSVVSLGGNSPVLGFNGGSAPDAGLSELTTGSLAIGNGRYQDFTGTLALGRIGIGTSSPFAQLSIVATSTTGVGAPTVLFSIGSTTGGTATSTLFSVNNKGVLSLNLDSSTSTYVTIGGQQFITASNSTSNVGVGFSALVNPIGANNTALGWGALRSAGNAYYNTAVGYTALASNTTGQSNSAFGVNALGSNSSGSGNTAFGYAALNISLGTANTAFGLDAGAEVFDGYSNVLIGDWTSLGGGNMVHGHHNIGIGSDVFFQSGSSATGNDQLNIGNLLFGSLPATSTAFNGSPVGSIGIGTSSPFATFAISQNASSTNTTIFVIASSTVGLSTTTLFTVLNNGNVGIGTTSPGQRLAVQGDMFIAGNITSTSTFASIFPYASSTAISSSNGFYIGDYTGIIGSTTRNNFDFAGATSSVLNLGTFNYAIGYGAMQFATTTNFAGNIGIGHNALQGSSTALNTGSNNTAIGQGTLQANTTGNFNTALGASALASNVSGSENVAIGHAALNVNVTGSYNVAIGGDAIANGPLSHNTSGSNNIAIGRDTLNLNTTGNNNTAVGHLSGYSMTSGYSNTLLGDNTSINSTITTGFGNIGLGSNIYFQSPTVNQQLNIGNLIFGTLPATSTSFNGSPVGSIGIGTSSPFATFAISQNASSTNTTIFAISSSTVGLATTTIFSISNAGVVGIGTSSPNTLYGGTFASAGPIYVGGLPATATSTFQGNVQVQGTLQVGTSSIYFTGSDNTATGPSINIGTSSNSKLALHAKNGETAIVLFAIGSSTANSTTTLFSVSNTGTTTLGNFGTCSGARGLTTDASGNIVCGAITGTASAFAFTPATNFGVNTNATTTPIWFQQGLMASSTSRIASTTFDISGNVGIGTSTPDAMLTINCSSTACARIYGTGNFEPVLDLSTTTPNTGAQFLRDTSLSNFWAVKTITTGNNLGLFTDNTPTHGIYIQTGGNVGIGTTTPKSLLTVGDAVVSVSQSSTVTIAQRSSDTVALSILSPSTGKDPTLQFCATSFCNYIELATTTGALWFGSDGFGNNPTLTVQKQGNVGIGSTSPQSLLTVAGGGDIRLSGTLDPGDLIFSTSTGEQARIYGDPQGAAKINFSTGANTDSQVIIDDVGRVGIGTTSPGWLLSVTNAVSTAQTVIAYDTTNYSKLLTSSVGDLFVYPSGNDTLINNGNLWVCTGGSDNTNGCPAGTPTAPGSLVVETAIGIATSTPVQALGVAGKLFVSNGLTTNTLGTATSTFMGDVKILGKLDVSTIDPVYSIDGIKYATYGASTIGIHEETLQTVHVSEKGTKGYVYRIKFDDLKAGSDLWLFYQVTDFGQDWQHLVVSLTPAFDGDVYYEKDAAHNELVIHSSVAGEVSMRLAADRYDYIKWQNLRPDQDASTGHVLQSKI